MSQYNGTRYRGESSRYVKKPTREEPEIIKVPAFDYSDLIEKFKLTLVGRMFHKDDKVDVQGNRLRVSINGDDPIHLERKIGFDNGDVVAVTLKYEDLHRYCYTCRRISHEEGTCPELNEDQRERNRITRLEAKEKEEIANREAFSIPLPRKEGRAQSPLKD
ncbi:unnamed protein product, partial [Brassica oleracea var. botrytis]